MWKVLMVVALAAAVAGCTSTRAAAPIERPTLEVPPPPPRVIEAAPPPEVPNPEPIPPLPPEKPASQAKPRPGSRDATARDTQKPETAKPDPAPAPVQEPPPSTTPAPPVPAVRTPATPDAAAADRRIRDSLRGTEDIFRTIDRARLRPERQTAYDDAKGSIDGAYAALKSANFELAQQMADKAEKLVRELQTR